MRIKHGSVMPISGLSIPGYLPDHWAGGTATWKCSILLDWAERPDFSVESACPESGMNGLSISRVS